MELMPQELREQLPPLYTNEKLGEEAMVLAHFFNPVGSGDWFITEFDGEDIMFGLCHIHEPELGYVSLAELQSLRLPLGMGIERDLYWKPKTITEVKRQKGWD